MRSAEPRMRITPSESVAEFHRSNRIDGESGILRSGWDDDDVPLRPSMALAQEEHAATMKAFNRILKGTQEFEGMADIDHPYRHPDDLLREKGLEVLMQMLRECDMCSAATSYLLLAAVSPGGEFSSGGEDNKAVEAKDFQEKQKADLEPSWLQMQLNTEDCAPRGFSLSEIVHGDQYVGGDFIGKQPIAEVQARNPEYIEFKSDAFGMVEREGVWQRNYSGMGVGTYIKAPLTKVMYTAFWPRNDNPYGEALLRPAYPWYFLKMFAVKQWARFIERFGVPFIAGKVPPETKAAERARYLDLLNQLRMNIVAVLDDTLSIEAISQQGRTGDLDHATVITTCNRGIARSMLLPAMVMEKDATGSLALAKNQSETQFVWILRYISALCDGSINRRIVKPSHLHNYGERVPTPTWKTKDFVQEDMVIKATVWKILKEIGYTFSTRVTQQAFGLPEQADDDPLLIGSQPEPQTGFEGVTKEDVESYTQMVHELVQDHFAGRSITPATHVHFPEEQMAQMVAKRRKLDDLEKLIPFDQMDRDQELAVQFWAETGGGTLQEIADEIEKPTNMRGSGGKDDGDRP